MSSIVKNINCLKVTIGTEERNAFSVPIELLFWYAEKFLHEAEALIVLTVQQGIARGSADAVFFVDAIAPSACDAQGKVASRLWALVQILQEYQPITVTAFFLHGNESNVPNEIQDASSA